MNREINNRIYKTFGPHTYEILVIGFTTFLLVRDYFGINIQINNIVATCFVLAIFDVVFKKILLLDNKNNYYCFIINNIITIISIYMLTFIIKKNYDNFNLVFFFNLAFACLFYETIIFKLYNYNNFYNKRLRTFTKLIIRLATIHIIMNFLNNKEYDEEWFNLSFSQIIQFSLFEILFCEHLFENK
jgi:hypothetical protein